MTVLETKIGIGALNKTLSQHLNRVAYGGETLIITSRGDPKVVILSIAAYRGLVAQIKEAQEKNG